MCFTAPVLIAECGMPNTCDVAVVLHGLHAVGGVAIEAGQHHRDHPIAVGLGGGLEQRIGRRLHVADLAPVHDPERVVGLHDQVAVRCCTMAIGSGKSGGSAPSTFWNAGTPPAEAAMTTSA
jgi:hypothetical protein